MRFSTALVVALGVAVVVPGSTLGSAIPMWEFLSRGEKMSHLFNMFVKQVQDYCDSLSMPDCNKVLLVYGLTNLAKMEEDSLDKMDPYQHGATDIIWQSMMKGTYKAPGAAKDKEPLDYNYASAAGPGAGSGSNSLGSQEQASAQVEHYAAPGPSQYVIGPMVVRVMPDGRPVPDSRAPLPKDEDAEEFKAMRSRPVPTIDEIMSRDAERAPPSRPQPHAVFASPPPHFRIPAV
ncbi:rhythmically expressed gene 5 protein isoform X2 [Bacillus rossius redtenbacheri]|uniref:rhythmically expressed gene 5 protein isoform X2 n=1 Tax=Bacillus rossius redtenbacheri TaxID=93214 RepID=UPI002FDDEEA5